MTDHSTVAKLLTLAHAELDQLKREGKTELYELGSTVIAGIEEAIAAGDETMIQVFAEFARKKGYEP